MQPNLDLFGKRTLWKRGLNQWDAAAAQSPALGSHLMSFLPDARHHGKVLREIFGDDAANSLPLQLLGIVQFCQGVKYMILDEVVFIEKFDIQSRLLPSSMPLRS